MGIYSRGIPEQTALDLADKYSLTTFVETGTHVGKTALFAANWFNTVYTIESEPYYYDIAEANLQYKRNVALLFGSSQEVLPTVVRRIVEPTLFWLDAHWSRDLKGQRPFVVNPVLDEIAAIKQLIINHVIMIDDARLFSGDHGWPAFHEIAAAIGYSYDIWVEQDVIYASTFL